MRDGLQNAGCDLKGQLPNVQYTVYYHACTTSQKHWRNGAQVKDAITEAHLQADKALLGSKSGFMGLGR